MSSKQETSMRPTLSVSCHPIRRNLGAPHLTRLQVGNVLQFRHARVEDCLQQRLVHRGVPKRKLTVAAYGSAFMLAPTRVGRVHARAQIPRGLRPVPIHAQQVGDHLHGKHRPCASRAAGCQAHPAHSVDAGPCQGR